MSKRKSLSLPIIVIYATLMNAGASFVWPLTTMYVNRDLHQSLVVAGIVSLFLSIFMMVGNYLGGYLFDKKSPYHSILFSIAITGISLLGLIFFHSWPMYAILLMPVGFGNGMNLTLMNSYATLVSKKNSQYVFNLLYVGINLGMVIGTASVGFLFKLGIGTVFIVATLSYLIILMMALFSFNVDFSNMKTWKQKSMSKANRRQKTYSSSKHSKLYLIIAIIIMSLSVYLAYSIWSSVMSVYMTKIGISFVAYSWIWVVNGVLIVIGQVPINRLFKKMNIALQIIIGVIILGSSFLLLPYTRTYIGFALNIAWLTIGEMMSLPNIPAWLDKFAKVSEKGRYQAYFNTSMTAGRAVGPLINGLIVDSLSYAFLFNSAGFLVIIATALVGVFNYYYYKRS